MRQLDDIEQDLLLALEGLPGMFTNQHRKGARVEVRELCAEYVEAHDMCTRETLPPGPPADDAKEGA